MMGGVGGSRDYEFNFDFKFEAFVRYFGRDVLGKLENGLEFKKEG